MSPNSKKWFLHFGLPCFEHLNVLFSSFDWSCPQSTCIYLQLRGPYNRSELVCIANPPRSLKSWINPPPPPDIGNNFCFVQIYSVSKVGNSLSPAQVLSWYISEPTYFSWNEQMAKYIGHSETTGVSEWMLLISGIFWLDNNYALLLKYLVTTSMAT